MKILNTIMDSFFSDPEDLRSAKKMSDNSGEDIRQEELGGEVSEKGEDVGRKDAEVMPDDTLIEEWKENALLRKNKEAAFKLANYYWESDNGAAAFWYHYAYTSSYVYPLIQSQILSIFGEARYSAKKLEEAKSMYSDFQYQILMEKVKRVKHDIEVMEQTIRESGDFSSVIELGEKYESLGNYSQALQKYFIAKDAGLIDAYLKIAGVYMQLGDFQNGMQWLEKAEGYTSFCALGYLVRIYEEMEDRENMMRCYIRLAERGDMSVCLKMARLYHDDMELEKAAGFYRQALDGMREKGTDYDLCQIEKILQQLETLLELSDDPIERLEKIFNLYGRYARQAAIKLGTIYYLGVGIERDLEKAAYWYHQADV